MTTTNYYRVVPITDEEIRDMYMLLPKEELINMLIANQRIIEKVQPTILKLEAWQQ